MKHLSLLTTLLISAALTLGLGAGSARAANAAWVAEWEMSSGLREAKKSGFKDIVLFAAYFNSVDRPLLSESMRDLLADKPESYFKAGQNLFISVVNDSIDDKGKSVFKDPELVKRLMADQQSRDKHKQDLLALLDRGPFVGLEIDYEQVDMDDWPALLTFAGELSAELKTKGKRLRFLLEPKEKYLTAELPDGPEYALMGYNLFGTHSGPGPKANEEFIAKLAGWCDGMTKKPALALASGGFGWAKNKSTLGLTESKALAWAKGARAEITRDPDSGYMIFTAGDKATASPVPSKDVDGSQYEVWFADGETLAKLADSAKAHGFADINFWRLGGNDAKSLAAFEKSIR